MNALDWTLQKQDFPCWLPCIESNNLSCGLTVFKQSLAYITVPSDTDFQSAVTKLQIISSRAVLLFSVLPSRLHILRVMLDVFSFFSLSFSPSLPSKHGLFFMRITQRSSSGLGLDQTARAEVLPKPRSPINIFSTVKNPTFLLDLTRYASVGSSSAVRPSICATGSENVSFSPSGTENCVRQHPQTG